MFKWKKTFYFLEPHSPSLCSLYLLFRSLFPLLIHLSFLCWVNSIYLWNFLLLSYLKLHWILLPSFSSKVRKEKLKPQMLFLSLESPLFRSWSNESWWCFVYLLTVFEIWKSPDGTKPLRRCTLVTDGKDRPLSRPPRACAGCPVPKNWGGDGRHTYCPWFALLLRKQDVLETSVEPLPWSESSLIGLGSKTQGNC